MSAKPGFSEQPEAGISSGALRGCCTSLPSSAHLAGCPNAADTCEACGGPTTNEYDL
jgi:hypothetical protein